MAFWLPMAIGAGVGLAKSHFIDRPRADRQRQLAAQTAAYSPWTGMQPQQVQEADYLGPALQGGMTGAMLGQASATQGQQEQLTNLQSQYMENQNKLMQQQLGGGGLGAAGAGGMNMGFRPIGPQVPPGFQFAGSHGGGWQGSSPWSYM